MNNILLTGVGGFVASNIAQRLLDNGCHVEGCDDFSFGFMDNVPTGLRLSIGSCELLTDDYLSTFDILIISHCSNIIWAQDNPLETFQNNSLKTIKLFEKFKGKIIYLSTSSIYGNANVIPTPETSEPKCTNAYDTSKYIAELYLKQRGNYTTLRLNNTYGANQRPNSAFSGVLGKFVDCAINDRAMKIYGDSTDTRSYTYVDDVVDAVIKAVELPSLNTEINIGSPIEISTMDLCRLVWKLVDKPVQYSIVKPRSIDSIKRRALDCTKAKELLGWEAETDLETGVKKTILWQQSLS